MNAVSPTRSSEDENGQLEPLPFFILWLELYFNVSVIAPFVPVVFRLLKRDYSSVFRLVSFAILLVFIFFAFRSSKSDFQVSIRSASTCTASCMLAQTSGACASHAKAFSTLGLSGSKLCSSPMRGVLRSLAQLVGV